MSRPRPRVLLTRTAEGNARWRRRLERLGAEVFELPCLRCAPSTDPDLARDLRSALRSASWLVLTSPRGAQAVADLGISPPDSCDIAAVGPATSEACERLFGRYELQPDESHGAGLARTLRQKLTESLPEVAHRLMPHTAPAPPTEIVVAAAEGGRRDLEAELAGIDRVELRRFAVYRTIPIGDAGWPPDLEANTLDGIFFASPSAVAGFLHRRGDLDGRAVSVAIGPTTAAALTDAGSARLEESIAIASEPTLDGLWQAFTAARDRVVAPDRERNSA